MKLQKRLKKTLCVCVGTGLHCGSTITMGINYHTLNGESKCSKITDTRLNGYLKKFSVENMCDGISCKLFEISCNKKVCVRKFVTIINPFPTGHDQ